MTERLVIDTFAGPGGWDVGARRLGLDPVGVEFDDAACKTRAAAGLRTVQADVASRPFADDLDVWGEISSPPCPTFSQGRRTGGQNTALREALAGIEAVGTAPYGEYVQYLTAAVEFTDPRTKLTVQPLIYALTYLPEWVTWEQVPTVLPVWEACADVLRARGYSVVTGVLNAADYGVPQARKRAILIASRVRPVELPSPTHDENGANGLKPWVTLAGALGWDEATTRAHCRPPGELDSGVIAYGLSWDTWPLHRPSTTVAGSTNRVPPPGYRKPHERQYGTGTVRDLTIAELATLQSFPADHPFTGNLGQCRLQVGNAIPPLMAAHILSAATGIALDLEAPVVIVTTHPTRVPWLQLVDLIGVASPPVDEYGFGIAREATAA